MSDGTLKLAPTLEGGIAGDLQAHMQTIELDTLQFATSEGLDLERYLKKMGKNLEATSKISAEWRMGYYICKQI